MGKPPIVPYRLYRFLTELEDILLAESDDEIRLHRIAPLARHFLSHSPWIELQAQPPHPDKGWAVSTLYDEFDYPLTVQLVSWKPGSVSTIHNHAAWGLVAILSGQEKNRFWRRSQTALMAERNRPLDMVGEQMLQPGDIITFMPDAIHQIEIVSEEPVVSFNLYGETQRDRRFQFDALTGAATLF